MSSISNWALAIDAARKTGMTQARQSNPTVPQPDFDVITSFIALL